MLKVFDAAYSVTVRSARLSDTRAAGMCSAFGSRSRSDHRAR
eukprot:COSAG02_NODE_85_length_39411_cov_50.018493_2_plen_42_part_00